MMRDATPAQIAAWDAFERARAAWLAKRNPIVSRETEIRVAAYMAPLLMWLRASRSPKGTI